MKTINRIKILFFLLLLINKTQAQVGIGINPPDPSAMLHVQATDKGILIPRMTEAQRIAIQNPAEGLEVYQTNNTKGFWYFTDGQWKSLSSPNNNGGKHTLYLADNITDAQAAAKIATDVGPNTQEIRIIRCTNLTTVNLSILTNPTEIYISGNALLQSVNFDNVETVDGGVYIDQCPALTSMPFSHIKNIGQTVNGTYGLQITNTGLVNLNTPLMAKINGTININNNSALTAINFPFITEHPILSTSGPNIDAFRITQNNALTSISLPLLATCSDMYIGSNNILSAISIPLLTTGRSLYIFANPMLNSISAALLNTVNGFSISGNNNLPSINLPALTNINQFTISTNLLTTPLSFPALKKIGLLTIGGNTGLTGIQFPVLDSVVSTFSIGGNPLLTSISCPIMVKVGDIALNGNAALPSFTLPLLNRTSNEFTHTISGNNALVSISLPALVTCAGNLDIYNNINLVSVSFDALSTLGNTWHDHNYNANKFSSATVNYVLHKLATVTGGPASSDVIYLMQTVAAPPTGQGISDRDYLINVRGCYVSTD